MDLVTVEDVRGQIAAGIRDEGDRPFPAMGRLVLPEHVVGLLEDDGSEIPDLVEQLRGRVGVDVEAEGVPGAGDDERVAEARDLALQLLFVEPGSLAPRPGLDQALGAIAAAGRAGGDLDDRLDRGRFPLDGEDLLVRGLGQEIDHALEEEDHALGAGVDDVRPPHRLQPVPGFLQGLDRPGLGPGQDLEEALGLFLREATDSAHLRMTVIIVPSAGSAIASYM